MSGGLLVLGVIIILSFGIVVAVMYYGKRPDVDAGHHADSKAVAYWTARAAREEERRLAVSGAAAAAASSAVTASGDDDEEKERKRQEALARKAARAAKSTSGE